MPTMVIKLTRLIKVFMWVLHLVLKDYDDCETACLRQINSLLERGIPKDTETLNARNRLFGGDWVRPLKAASFQEIIFG